MSLKISIIQAELHWENVEQNLALFTQKIAALDASTEIIVLPEMFNTGFSMKSSQLAERMDGKTVGWMKEQAQQHTAMLVGSLIVVENGNYYNRLVVAQPNGQVYTYDKRHLFRMAGEQEHFSAGDKRLVVHYKGWRICPLVCYDLRFPVWSRNRGLEMDAVQDKDLTPNPEVAQTAYDVLIYVANWPTARKQAWSKLLEARAIENQCYVVGVNRVGQDGNDIDYSGNSVIVNPKGEAVVHFEENEVATASVDLSLDALNDFRAKFPVSLDGDIFTL